MSRYTEVKRMRSVAPLWRNGLRLDLPDNRHIWTCPSDFARCASAFRRFGLAFYQLSMGTAVPSLVEGTVAEARYSEE
jgi:hypothetical protein